MRPPPQGPRRLGRRVWGSEARCARTQDPTGRPRLPRPRVAGAEKAKPEAPWLLRVLGLGDSVASDDDSFWDDRVEAPKPKPKRKPIGGAAGGEEEEEDDDDDDEDTGGLDTLDDLLG